MVMRFHPGLAIGHTYHDSASESAVNCFSTAYGSHGLDKPSGVPGNGDSGVLEAPEVTADSDGSMNSMDGGWPGEDEVDSEYDNQDINGHKENIDDEEFLALDDMYE